MKNPQSSYLDKAPKVILFLVLVFAILALTSKDEGSASITQVGSTNIAYNDADGDGIENKMDPCIQSESQIADGDKDGCPDVYGRLKEAYYQLDQINPVCEDEKCKELLHEIARQKHSLRPLLNVQHWKTVDMIKCKAPQLDTTLARIKKKIINICPGYKECNEIKETLVSAIKNITIASREYTKQKCE